MFYALVLANDVFVFICISESPFFSIGSKTPAAPMGLPPKNVEVAGSSGASQSKQAPGPPPGPPPGNKQQWIKNTTALE